MCGIAGILTLAPRAPIDAQDLAVSADALAHRGPDAAGYWQAPGVGLAHRRLSIIDLAGGDQPIGNEDGSLQVVFNGEIYNYRALQAELQARGHCFRTNSDTEVLVHLYEELGERLVERLRGMFAFALWDSRRQRLLLARDRVGLKPLYYYRDAQRLIFGSEIKAILAWPGVDPELDLEALDDYLTFGVVPGARSIFRSIRKLPAAHTLVIERHPWHSAPRRYWHLNVAPDESRSVDDWVAELSAKFDETVAAHRVADVPIGAFLSGGVDSSAVVGSLVRNGRDSVRTFSIGFQEDEFSELPFAREVAAQYGTQHVEEIVTVDAARGLDDLVHFYDEPFADASAIPTLAVCRAARQHVKVTLSGDGGDEAFGGYARYAHDLRESAFRARIPTWLRRGLLSRIASVWPQADWLPRPLRIKTALTNLSLDAGEAYANTISLFRSAPRRRLLKPGLQQQLNGYRAEGQIVDSFGPRDSDPLSGMIAADVAMLLPDDFLTKVDRASMACGLEVRPPLVDHELLELAARVPSRYKVNRGETKWIFKQVCAAHLPSDIVWRKKQGFDVPLDQWLRGPLKPQLEATLLDGNARLSSYLDPQGLRALCEAHERGWGQHGRQLWTLLVLGRWLEHYQRSPRRRPKPLVIEGVS